MKILVTIKRVPDPEQKPKLKGTELDLSQASWIVNTFDDYAMEAALRLNENGATGERVGEIVVATVGPKDAARELRSCLAMGADRAILVDGSDDALDADSVARLLKAVVEKEKPDLVLAGKQAMDGDSNQVGQILAALLGWPQATFAAGIEIGRDDSPRRATVTREVDGGVEVKRVALPCVITVDLRVVQSKAIKNGRTPESHAYADGARYPSLKGIMAAKKKELKEITPRDLAVQVAPKVRTVAVAAPTARKAGIKVADVAELVQRLHDEAKVV